MTAKVPGAKIGRPSKYADDVALAICKRVAMGESLVKIVADKGMPSYSSVMRWRLANPSFESAIARARMDSADVLVDQMLSIADDPRNRESSEAVQAAKLMVDARRWIAARLKPQSYGEQLNVKADMALNITVQRFSDAPTVAPIVVNSPHLLPR